MAEQMVTEGFVIALHPTNPSLVTVSNGIYQVQVYLPANAKNVRIGNSYLVHKVGTQYYLGPEVKLL